MRIALLLMSVGWMDTVARRHGFASERRLFKLAEASCTHTGPQSGSALFPGTCSESAPNVQLSAPVCPQMSRPVRMLCFINRPTHACTRTDTQTHARTCLSILTHSHTWTYTQTYLLSSMRPCDEVWSWGATSESCSAFGWTWGHSHLQQNNEQALGASML